MHIFRRYFTLKHPLKGMNSINDTNVCQCLPSAKIYGETGIRTRVATCAANTLSRRAPSSARPSLRARIKQEEYTSPLYRRQVKIGDGPDLKSGPSPILKFNSCCAFSYMQHLPMGKMRRPPAQPTQTRPLPALTGVPQMDYRLYIRS